MATPWYYIWDGITREAPLEGSVTVPGSFIEPRKLMLSPPWAMAHNCSPGTGEKDLRIGGGGGVDDPFLSWDQDDLTYKAGRTDADRGGRTSGFKVGQRGTGDSSCAWQPRPAAWTCLNPVDKTRRSKKI